MTAPTTRETADHAELAWSFEALAVEASAARNLDGAESMMVSVQAIYDLITSRNALLSEVEALRGALEGAEKDASSWSRCAGEVVTIGEGWKERFVQAERQRDEAVGLLRKFNEAWRSGCGWLPAMNSLDDEIAAFLANQGADQ